MDILHFIFSRVKAGLVEHLLKKEEPMQQYLYGNSLRSWLYDNSNTLHTIFVGVASARQYLINHSIKTFNTSIPPPRGGEVTAYY